MKKTTIVHIVIMAVVCLPLHAQKSVALHYDKSLLSEASRAQLEIFLKVQPLVEKINTWQGPVRRLALFRRRIARLLKKAAADSSDAPQKEYLDALAGDVLQNRFASSPGLWLKQQNPQVDIILGRKPGEKPAKLVLFVLVYRPELTRKAEKYRAVLDKMLDNLPQKKRLFSLDVQEIAPILAADIAYASEPVGKAVLVFPANLEQAPERNFKMILLANLLEARLAHLVKPTAEKALGKNMAEFVTLDAYFSNLLMHRLSHFLGPLFVDKKTQSPVTVQQALKDHFGCIEEIRADAAAIFNTTVLKDEKLVTEEEVKHIVHTHAAYILAKIRTGPDSQVNRAELILFNYFLKNGGFVFDINEKKLRIQLDKLKNAAKKLLSRVTQIQLAGDYTAARDFVSQDKLASPSEELKLLLKKLDKMPRFIKISGFSEKTGEPPAEPSEKAEQGETKK